MQNITMINKVNKMYLTIRGHVKAQYLYSRINEIWESVETCPEQITITKPNFMSTRPLVHIALYRNGTCWSITETNNSSSIIGYSNRYHHYDSLVEARKKLRALVKHYNTMGV
jgi:hypothetical protein